MGKINYGRVVLGGVVGGIVAGILWWFFNGVLLFQRWIDTTKALNPSGHNAASPAVFLGSMVLIFLIGGILTTWMYAVIRPRFGAGVRTAACVGLITWVFGFLLSNWSWALTGFFSRRLLFYNMLAGMVELVVGAIIGAALYKEVESTAAYPAAAPQANH
jgi:hypothetical protein